MFCIDNAKVHLITRIQKSNYVLMKLEPSIILKLFLNLSDFRPRYSYKLYSFKRECHFISSKEGGPSARADLQGALY